MLVAVVAGGGGGGSGGDGGSSGGGGGGCNDRGRGGPTNCWFTSAFYPQIAH